MATQWSVIVNRKDDPDTDVWKEWRSTVLDPSLIPPSVGGGNFVQVLVDFGYAPANEGDLARTTVTGLPWVTANSIILCAAAAIASPDHDPDDVTVEGIVAYAENLVPGIGFDVVALAPQNTWGRYFVNATGK